MQRTYLALAGAALVGSAVAMAVPGTGLTPQGQAGELFEARPVEPDRYAVLGRPLGNGEWTLLVLEQIKPAPLCWQRRPDGLVDPSLNRFDYTGICGRYLDSNGYSVRLGNQEGSGLAAGPLRLRLEQSGQELRLLASSPAQNHELVVGRAAVPVRDRDAFVALRLNPGWELQRRRYGNQTLNHLYFANAASAEQILAAASRPEPSGPLGARRAWSPSRLPPPPPPPSTALAPDADGGWRGQPAMASGGEGRAISLQVIPFRE
jgi:hypothetical protein